VLVVFLLPFLNYEKSNLKMYGHAKLNIKILYFKNKSKETIKKENKIKKNS